MANLRGIGIFIWEIIGLISLGKKESIKEIEKHFDQGDIVEYLYNKYRASFFTVFDNSIYDNASINKYFSNYAGVIEGNESRKYGIQNDDDGLLLIIALVIDKVEQEAIHWEID